jgi:hypothetical protein
VSLRVASESNLREHFMDRDRRRRRQERDVGWHLLAASLTPPAPPALVVLTRVAPRWLDQGNLGAGLKFVQDSVAKYLRLDDGDHARVRWVYAQRRGLPGEYRLEVVVRTAPDLDAAALEACRTVLAAGGRVQLDAGPAAPPARPR